MQEKKKCLAEGCEVLTASKVGYCAKHWHLHKKSNGKAHEPRANEHARVARRKQSDDAVIELPLLTEAQLDRFLAGLSLSRKAALANAILTGNLGDQ